MFFQRLKFFFKFLLLFFSLVFVFVNYSLVQAEDLRPEKGLLEEVTEPMGEAAVNAGYTAEEAQAGYLEAKIGKIIQVFLSFLGVIALILLIYAGFLWMTAGGSEEKVGKAKKIMKSAFIGLVIILFSGIISVYIMSKLQ